VKNRQWQEKKRWQEQNIFMWRRWLMNAKLDQRLIMLSDEFDTIGVGCLLQFDHSRKTGPMETFPPTDRHTL
jgi:hypothetical protein